MKLTVTQENLSQALTNVSRAVSTKPSIPVLSNILLEVKDDQLQLSGTDLEFSITQTIGADIQKKGSISVSARMFTEFVNSLSHGKILIELRDSTLTVSNDQSTSDFVTIPSDEFPPIPTTTGGEPIFDLDSDKFTNTVRKVTIACAKDDSRPILTGVLVKGDDKTLEFVGLDGFRLSEKKVTLSKKLKQSIKVIIPSKSLIELSGIVERIGEKKKIQVSMVKNKNQVLFVYENVLLSTRLIEGEYPDYNEILPSEHIVEGTVSKEDFEGIVKVVGIFARSAVGNKSAFNIDVKKKELSLASYVNEVGENRSVVSMHSVKGENFQTAFNTKFLSDFLSITEGDEIIFETNGPTSPGVFKNPDESDFLHIIMPMLID